MAVVNLNAAGVVSDFNEAVILKMKEMVASEVGVSSSEGEPYDTSSNFSSAFVPISPSIHFFRSQFAVLIDISPAAVRISAIVSLPTAEKRDAAFVTLRCAF